MIAKGDTITVPAVAIREARYELAKRRPAVFRDLLTIDCPGEIKRLGDVIEPWQAEAFEGMDNGFLRAIGRNTLPKLPTYSRAYLERPRGHSKTTDMSTLALWSLYAAKRPIRGVAAAGDKDQAKLLRNAVWTSVRHNEWLSQMVDDPGTGRQRPLIDVQNYTIRNTTTGSFIEIISSEAATNYGHLCDVIICDELTHWKKPDLWEALISTAAKRPTCMFVVIANAGSGQGSSWQWNVREATRVAPDWFFSRLDGPQASWISETLLAEQRKMLPPKAYNRLWLNQWQTESGDALDQADVIACTTGREVERGDQEWIYIGSLDLGLRNDHAAFVVLGINPNAKLIKVATIRSWAPADFGGQILLSQVEREILELQRQFGFVDVIFDPWQAVRMAEILGDNGLNMVEWPSTPKNLDVMAMGLLSVFRNRMIELYPHKQMESDLMRLSIVTKQNGQFKLEATRDENGHADRAIALAMGLPAAMQLMTYGVHVEPETHYVELG